MREQRAKVNEEHDVEGLCREFPQRLEELKAKKGNALKCGAERRGQRPPPC